MLTHANSCQAFATVTESIQYHADGQVERKDQLTATAENRLSNLVLRCILKKISMEKRKETDKDRHT
jgi:hypothetical protein